MNDVKVVEVSMNGTKVGRIALTPEKLCAFEYDPSYIATGVSIAPLSLPLQSGLFVAKRTPFHGGFGVFDDSLPDGWGSLILDRYLKRKRINPSKLTLLQRLSLVGKVGRGALTYLPDYSELAVDEAVDLDHLATEAQKVLACDYDSSALDTLYKYGGSPGGARPKVFVSIDGDEWLVKFKSTLDPNDIGQKEYVYSQLAKKCGINMPETRLLNGKYFAVKRFDRAPFGKIHTVSVAGMLHADYRIPSLDYIELLKLCLILTKNMEEVYALFRQMVFNVVIRNRDDHAKNFSFQLIHNEWKCAPAYDLLPSGGFNGFHTTTVNHNGEPTARDMIAVAEKVGLHKRRALDMIEEITTICKIDSTSTFSQTPTDCR
ncbi:MAG: type II toxin-antitoxin system HipA family toxin [Prevotellaceae bacterium]|jgi:serine/threonine-protein kinase HipA|nr:type II toxin-antitoxin system HipA family toxin [Prevotellaceae bacterium]